MSTNELTATQRVDRLMVEHKIDPPNVYRLAITLDDKLREAANPWMHSAKTVRALAPDEYLRVNLGTVQGADLQDIQNTVARESYQQYVESARAAAAQMRTLPGAPEQVREAPAPAAGVNRWWSALIPPGRAVA